ncbi:MAG: TIM barrel protein [Clostridiaceae bacterium]|nr:TIM barrel protein [Clostridiaceae bacterium]
MKLSDLKIGHTAITWPDSEVETAVQTISELGFRGVEVFGWTLKTLKEQNRLNIFEKHGIPLVSSYFSLNIIDPAKKDESMAKMISWLEILRDMDCHIAATGGDSIDRRGYNYFDHKDYIVSTVNEYAKVMADYGVACCFHQHTATPVESFSETVDFMNSVNTEYVKFGPDVGQLYKGGSDPMVIFKEIVHDFIEVIQHVHLKDYDGVPLRHDENGREIDSSGFACYTPLGQGVVDLPSILKFLAEHDYSGMVNVELDGGPVVPIPQREALTISKNYLLSVGCTFAK